MTGEFKGKTAIITGAASGIGAATAHLLCERGAQVFAVDINPVPERAEGGDGSGVLVSHVADLRHQAQVEAMIAAAVERFGKLDILINNAGIGELARTTELAPERWREVLAVDLDAVFYACRKALPHLIESKGCIVNTASISGIAADYAFTVYNVAKAGVIGLTRVMAIDYAAEGVRVNSVSPGLIQTAAISPMPQGLIDQFVSRVPMRRAGEAREMAEVICFLASSRASYITGHNLVADGGLTAHTGQPDSLAYFLSNDLPRP